jgi:hypothetical protein
MDPTVKATDDEGYRVWQGDKPSEPKEPKVVVPDKLDEKNNLGEKTSDWINLGGVRVGAGSKTSKPHVCPLCKEIVPLEYPKCQSVWDCTMIADRRRSMDDKTF